MEKKGIFNNTDYSSHIIFAVLKRNWMMAISCIVAFVLFGIITLRYTEKVYESNSFIQLNKFAGISNIVLNARSEKQKKVQKEVQILNSNFLIERAIDKLNIEVSFFSEGNILVTEHYKSKNLQATICKIKNNLILDKPIKLIKSNKYKQPLLFFKINNKELWVHPKNNLYNCKYFTIYSKISNEKLLEFGDNLFISLNSRKSTQEKFKKNLIVDPNTGTYNLIEVNYRSASPKFAQDVVLALIDSYRDFEKEMYQKSSISKLKLIDAQLQSLRNEMLILEDSLKIIQRVYGISSFENDTGSPKEKELKILFPLEDEILNLEIDVFNYKKLLNAIEVEDMEISTFISLFDYQDDKFNPKLNYLLGELREVFFEYENYQLEIKPSHYYLEKLKRKISSLKSDVIFSINQTILSKVRLKNELNRKLIHEKADNNSLPLININFISISSKINLINKYYFTLLEQRVIEEMNLKTFVSNVEVLKKANLAKIPISPNKRLVYFSFTIFGLFFAILLLLYKYLTYNEISGMADLREIINNKSNIIGEIPKTERTLDYSQIIVHNAPKSMITESFRSLRSNISFLNRNAKSIAITSTISGEGKTFVALNLAAIFALSGKRTIILDLDLRKPKIHLAFEGHNENGMSNLISENIGINDAIKHSEINDLDYISSGPIPPNPSELLLSSNFSNLLEKIKTMYDIVILDNPPIGLVSDGLQILANADVPIYVFRQNFSKRAFIDKVNDFYLFQNTKKMNFVLNGKSTKMKHYTYDYSYNYLDD